MEDDLTSALSHLNRAHADNPLNKITKEIENVTGIPRKQSYARPTLQNDDVPRAGELSSQVFNDLTTRIITELQETVEAQLTDIVNRRAHAIAQMDSLKAEIDKAFGEYEANAKKLQETINKFAGNVRKKVEDDTKEMIGLAQRLRDFADNVNVAHEKFFKD